MAAVTLSLVDPVFITWVARVIASSLGITVEFTDKRSSRPSVELLASTVTLAPVDDEDSTYELELVDVVEAVLLSGLLVDDLVDPTEFKTPLDPTPSPTTITTTITMTATNLVEIPFTVSLVATPPAKMVQRVYF